MFGKTKVEDIETWRKAKQWDKLINALSSQDQSVRVAAPLKLVDTTGHHGSTATIAAAFTSLLRCLADGDLSVLADAARSLPGSSSMTFGPRAATRTYASAAAR